MLLCGVQLQLLSCAWASVMGGFSVSPGKVTQTIGAVHVLCRKAPAGPGASWGCMCWVLVMEVTLGNAVCLACARQPSTSCYSAATGDQCEAAPSY